MNTQSIRNKLNLIDLFFETFTCDIFAVNEHWLHEEEVSLYVPKGFVIANIYTRNTTTTRGGGCCIYIKENISFKTLDLKIFCTDNDFEITAIIVPKGKVVVATLYRTPSSNVALFLTKFEALLTFLNKKYNNFHYIISADFNLNFKEKTNTEVKCFLNLLRSFNVYWLTEEPTRGEACLDNIVTTINKKSVNCQVIEPHISDHLGVFAQFCGLDLVENKLRETVRTKTVRDLSDNAITYFRNDLLQISWHQLNGFADVEQAFDYFMTLLTNSFEQCCRLKKVRVRSKVRKSKIKWFSPELKKIKEFTLYLYDVYKNSKGTDQEVEHKNQYLKAKKFFRNKIDETKKLENEKYISNSSNKCRAAWEVIKTESNIGTKQTQEIVIDSNSFNAYFTNIASNLNISVNNRKVPDNQALQLVNRYIFDKNLDHQLEFKWEKIQAPDVLKCVARLSSSNSFDYFGFSNKILKNIIEVICTPLTYLFNMMLVQGIFPKALKITKVTPIYKKGEKTNPASYRPISLIPIIGKVFESCIKQQLHLYFSRNNLYCKEQFGFVPGGSTVEAVEKVVESILTNFENKMISSALLIDLTKAFDCVSHKMLKDKFFSYGIRNNELKLITSYLNNRKQMVVQNKDQSSLKTVNVGVPQGSVLGPFLFVIAVNDFAFNVHCKSILYADDTTLINSSKYLEELTQKEKESLNDAMQWFDANCLVVNNQKTERIIFSLNSLIVKESKPVKLLGIHLDSKLDWHHHVDQLCKKLSRVVYLLRKLRNFVTLETTLTVYYALFQSHIRYGITLWGNSSGAKTVFGWQRKALRAITNVSYSKSCFPIFKDLKIMTLPNIYVYCCLVNVKETINDLKIRQDFHNYNTRKKYLLNLLQVRLEKTKSSHIYKEIELFNKLPENAWLVPLQKFKLVLDRWLKENVFYSISDFLTSDIESLHF